MMMMMIGSDEESYNALENSFYRHIRKVANLQKLRDEEEAKRIER